MENPAQRVAVAKLNRILIGWANYVGPSRFSLPSGTELSFEAQANGGMRLTITNASTAPNVFERFQPIKPSSSDLAQCRYASDELQATYRFAVKDGRLTMTVNGSRLWFLRRVCGMNFKALSILVSCSGAMLLRISQAAIFSLDAYEISSLV